MQITRRFLAAVSVRGARAGALLFLTVLLMLTLFSGGMPRTALPAVAQTPPTPAPRQWTRPAAPPARAPVLAPIDLLAHSPSAPQAAPATPPQPPSGNGAWSGPVPAGAATAGAAPRAAPRDLPRNTCQDYRLNEGQSASCTLNEGTWSWQVQINDSSCPGNISAIVIWPDNTQSSLTGFGACGGTQNTPPYPLPTSCCDEGNTGTITIKYTDPGANPPPQDSVWTVTFVEGDLLTPQITPINVQEGQDFTQVVANFTNTSPFQPVTPGSDFLASIDWGDGSPVENNLTVNGGAGGPYTVQGTHKYTDEGPEPNSNGGGGGNYLVHVTISDPGNKPPVGDAEFPVTVQEMDNINWTSNTITVSATEGQPVDDVLATFTDTGYPQNEGSDFTAQITWTNTSTNTQTTSQGTVEGSGGTFQITGVDPTTGEGYVPPDEGTYNLNITLSDNAPGGLLGGTPATVIADEGDSITPQGVPFTTTNEGTAVDGTIAVFSDSNTENTATDFAAIISWGDGTTQGTGVEYEDGTIKVDGHHVYKDEGKYNVKVTVIDDKPGNAKATAVGYITVTDSDVLNAGPAVTVNAAAGTAFNGQVAAVLDSGYNTADQDFKPNLPKDFRATIDWGDNTSKSSGTITADGSNAAQYDIAGSHTYRYAGTYTVKVTVSDDKPGPIPMTLASVTVTNAATVSGKWSTCKQGDVNCDGTVNSVDAQCLLNLLTGPPYNSAFCSNPPQGNPDVNRDGFVNHVDLVCDLRIGASKPATPACPIFGAPGGAANQAASTTASEPPVALALVPDGSVRPHQASSVSLQATAAGAGLGGWMIDLRYDPKQVQIDSCSAPAGSICNASYAPGMICIAGASLDGLSGSQTLATISVTGLRGGRGSQTLQIGSAALADPEGANVVLAGGPGANDASGSQAATPTEQGAE